MASGIASYGYDPTNQLTSATYTTNTGGHQPANESYSFDKNGNRTMTGYSTGSNNLIASDGTFNYTHDADGNQTVRTRISSSYASDYRTTYSWDYRNRLTDVVYYDNNSVLTKHVHFVYDVFDHLLATEVDATGDGSYNEIERYVLDVSPEIPWAGVPGVVLAQPVLQFGNNGNPTQRNLVGPDPAGVDVVLAQGAVSSPNQADVVEWMIDDNLGSPTEVTDNNGNVLDKTVRNSFGAIAYESNSSIVVWAGFAGGHVDPNTGLVNDYERWYQAQDAKFLSNDPKGFGAGDSDLSRYVLNNAIGRIDPTGEHPVVIVVVGVVYYLWPDTANAPAPEDPTYPSDPYEGMPGAIVAGLLSQAALLAAAKMAQYWAAATAAKAAAMASEPLAMVAPTPLEAEIALAQANIAALQAEQTAAAQAYLAGQLELDAYIAEIQALNAEILTLQR